MFCFFKLFPYYPKSLSPCFEDNATNGKNNKKVINRNTEDTKEK